MIAEQNFRKTMLQTPATIYMYAEFHGIRAVGVGVYFLHKLPDDAFYIAGFYFFSSLTSFSFPSIIEQRNKETLSAYFFVKPIRYRKEIPPWN